MCRASQLSPLRAIIHAGGLLEDATLLKQTLASFRTSLAPKLHGLLQLSAAATGSALDSITLFSSTSALLGPPGQGNYAVANAGLNSWAISQQTTGALSPPDHPFVQIEYPVSLEIREIAQVRQSIYVTTFSVLNVFHLLRMAQACHI